MSEYNEAALAARKQTDSERSKKEQQAKKFTDQLVIELFETRQYQEPDAKAATLRKIADLKAQALEIGLDPIEASLKKRVNKSLAQIMVKSREEGDRVKTAIRNGSEGALGDLYYDLAKAGEKTVNHAYIDYDNETGGNFFRFSQALGVVTAWKAEQLPVPVTPAVQAQS